MAKTHAHLGRHDGNWSGLFNVSTTTPSPLWFLNGSFWNITNSTWENDYGGENTTGYPAGDVSGDEEDGVPPLALIKAVVLVVVLGIVLLSSCKLVLQFVTRITERRL
ncbi:Hypp5727 [Branchiostoma lanceolatum]|uniref:Hypp5727 protein n=1 Tax=Branchiostoma lanceolatum TaxID=7740 RepID=A0A8J9W7B1_BRALA|nr:Hypp5727 [Branchiostoma lanceolatum]